MAIKLVKGLKHKSYKESQSLLGSGTITSLEKKRGDLIQVFRIVTGFTSLNWKTEVDVHCGLKGHKW